GGLGWEWVIFAGGARQLSTLAVGTRDQFGSFAMHFVLGVGAAKRFEHFRGRLPVLQRDQRSACVVLGRGTDARRGRCHANPQEMVGGCAIILCVSRKLTLLVDRGR